MRRTLVTVASILVVALVSCRRSDPEPPKPDPSATKAPDAAVVRPAAASSTAPAAAPSQAAAPPDAGAPSTWPVGAKTVLHVGDSTVGYTLGLSLELTKRFKAIGIRYESHTETAAGLHTFAKGKKTETLVKEKNPDVVFLTVGTNNLSVPHPDAYEDDVKAIVAQVGTKPCFFIGPINIEAAVKKQKAPGSPKDPKATGEAVVAMLRKNAGPCVFYDSYPLVIQRQEDEVHPTQIGAGRWADKIWEFLKPAAP